MSIAPARAWRHKAPARRVLEFAAWLLLVLALAWASRFVSERTLWDFVLDAPAQGADLAGRMFPPDAGVLPALMRPLWDTINIATLGTLLAMGLATPLAFLAARNTGPRFPGVRGLALLLIVTSRSVNSLIWALVFVLVLGPGILAGVLAIAMRSIGFIGKLLYEAIEEVDARPLEAIAASGASAGQLRVYGVVPQVVPAFAGICIFRWDINIREAAVLGLVGAGGIGVELISAVDRLAWGEAGTIFAAILCTVLASEWLSARVRRAVT